MNWSVSTSLQKSSFKVSIVNEFSSVLEQTSCDLPEISTDIENSSHVETTDEVLASGPGKWIAVVAGKEVFDSAVTFDEVSKNPLALSTEDMEISVATDMSSLKHLMDMDGSATEAFDSGTTMGASLKNSSAQHIEDSETTEKTSVSAFTDFTSDSVSSYELSALLAFDLSIAIDFEIYTVDTSVIQSPVISSRRKLQLSSFRDLALRNTSFV